MNKPNSEWQTKELATTFLEGVREAIGWALEDERGFRGSAQAFDSGLVILTDLGLGYALTADGRWREFGAR